MAAAATWKSHINSESVGTEPNRAEPSRVDSNRILLLALLSDTTTTTPLSIYLQIFGEREKEDFSDSIFSAAAPCFVVVVDVVVPFIFDSF